MEQKYIIIQFWVFSVPCIHEENYMFNMTFNYKYIYIQYTYIVGKYKIYLYEL